MANLRLHCLVMVLGQVADTVIGDSAVLAFDIDL